MLLFLLIDELQIALRVYCFVIGRKDNTVYCNDERNTDHLFLQRPFCTLSITLWHHYTFRNLV